MMITGSLMLMMSAPVESQTQDASQGSTQSSQGPEMAPAGPIQPDTAPAMQTADELNQAELNQPSAVIGAASARFDYQRSMAAFTPASSSAMRP